MCDRCYYDADVISQQQSEKAAASAPFVAVTTDNSLPPAVTPVVTISTAQAGKLAAGSTASAAGAPLGGANNSAEMGSSVERRDEAKAERSENIDDVVAASTPSASAEEKHLEAQNIEERKPSARPTMAPGRLVAPLWAAVIASPTARSSSGAVFESASSTIIDEHSSNEDGNGLLPEDCSSDCRDARHLDQNDDSSSSSSSISSHISQLTAQDLDLFMALTASKGASPSTCRDAKAASSAETLDGASAVLVVDDQPMADFDVEHDPLPFLDTSNTSSPGLRRRKKAAD